MKAKNGTKPSHAVRPLALHDFLGLDGAKFRRPVVPGDRMELEVKLEQRRSNIWKGAASATVDGNLCAQADLLAALTDREELPRP